MTQAFEALFGTGRKGLGKAIGSGLLALFVLWLVILPLASFGTHVTPVEHDGNPSCSSLGGGNELKVEPVEAGTYSDGTLSVTLSNVDEKMFDWSSNIGVDAVFVKGGPTGNLYSYDPESTGDTGLVAPDNGNGGRYGLSHVSFCYDFEAPAPSPSPSPSPSPTGPPTPSPSPSPTATPSPSPSPTSAGSPSPSPTATVAAGGLTTSASPSPASVLGAKITAKSESSAAVQGERLPATGIAVAGLLGVAAALLAVGVLAQHRGKKRSEKV